MKLLTPSEIKQANEAQLTHDKIRLGSTKDALAKAQKELNDTNDRFELTLANQQIRWAKEEQEHIERIDKLKAEIPPLEEQRRLLLIPIEEQRKKANDLFTQAEAVIADAKAKSIEVERKRQHNDEVSDLLQARLDEVAERENNVHEREQKLKLREGAVASEREHIKSLSKDLSIQLSKL